MSNITQENINKAKNILMTKGPYASYHAQNFQKYNYGDMTPVNNALINNMPGGVIVLTDSVYQMLTDIQYLTVTGKKEFPFFLYGKETGDNQIVFDQFFTQSPSVQETSASYGSQMVTDLTKKISEKPSDKLVVGKGHSHPPIGDFYENFSVGDLAGDIQFTESNRVFSDGMAETVSCVVTPSGDINFVYYDRNVQNFYRFTNVYVLNKDNTYTPVPCYGSGQQSTQVVER